MIEYQREYNKRLPYPLDWDEQKLLFSELAVHLRTMALFDVNTGLRDQELCGLEWAWEQRVPELDTPTMKRSVFLLPGSVTKNGRPRLAILNDVAQSIVESQREEPIRTPSRSSTSAAGGRGSGRCATAAGPPLDEEPRSGIVRSWVRDQRRDSSASGHTIFGIRLDDVYAPRA
jgi:integrase